VFGKRQRQEYHRSQVALGGHIIRWPAWKCRYKGV